MRMGLGADVVRFSRYAARMGVLCRRCRNVIGDHEPVVVVAEGEPRHTSVLNEQQPLPRNSFHRDCFYGVLQAFRSPPATPSR
jgi:hypothetical protein